MPSGAGDLHCHDPLGRSVAHWAVVRDAITAANSEPQSLIKFAPGLDGIITLQQGDLDIRTSVKIDANANGNDIAVSGRGVSRVFNISTVPSTPSHVTLVGFTVNDGRQNGNGGCVFVDDPASSLVLNDMVVTLCKAVGGSGGGMYNEGLTTFYSSIVENNTADLDGGGAGPAGICHSTTPWSPTTELVTAADYTRFAPGRR